MNVSTYTKGIIAGLLATALIGCGSGGGATNSSGNTGSSTSTGSGGNNTTANGSSPSLPTSLVAYIKASNPQGAAQFGTVIAISRDGKTVAIDAPNESSAATGINGNQSDNSVGSNGAVYVFSNVSGSWQQQAYIKPDYAVASQRFGNSLSLSEDGNTLAVGCANDSNGGGGINNQATVSVGGANTSGATYVYSRSGSNWAEQGYFKEPVPKSQNQFGTSVSLAGDGNLLAVGDPYTGSGGVVWLYSRSGPTWSQAQAVTGLSLGNTWLGIAVALSNDGSTLAVGTTADSGEGTGINPASNTLNINTAAGSGAVYVLTNSQGGFVKQAFIKPLYDLQYGLFGKNLSISDNGNVLAIGEYYDSSNATGINGNEADSSIQDSGAVYIVERSAGVWTTETYVKPSNPEELGLFGFSIAVSGDGQSVAVGAVNDDHGSSPLVANPATVSNLPKSGSVFVFTKTNGIWSQAEFLKASNPGISNGFGVSVALPETLSGLLVGAYSESGGSSGINGNQSQTGGVGSSGAGYLFN